MDVNDVNDDNDGSSCGCSTFAFLVLAAWVLSSAFHASGWLIFIGLVLVVLALKE